MFFILINFNVRYKGDDTSFLFKNLCKLAKTFGHFKMRELARDSSSVLKEDLRCFYRKKSYEIIGNGKKLD
ncbi:MAG: hypothetical protein CMP63_06125 [Flavobacteriales bacterium]|nr:hypothetical protein [Flavobacteriales bacterium]